MNLLSLINATQARINQIETSHFYTEDERAHRLKEANDELQKYTDRINEIEVNSPQIIS